MNENVIPVVMAIISKSAQKFLAITDDRKVKCLICGKEFNDLKNAIEHLMQNHAAELNNYAEKNIHLVKKFSVVIDNETRQVLDVQINEMNEDMVKEIEETNGIPREKIIDGAKELIKEAISKCLSKC